MPCGTTRVYKHLRQSSLSSTAFSFISVNKDSRMIISCHPHMIKAAQLSGGGLKQFRINLIIPEKETSQHKQGEGFVEFQAFQMQGFEEFQAFLLVHNNTQTCNVSRYTMCAILLQNRMAPVFCGFISRSLIENPLSQNPLVQFTQLYVCLLFCMLEQLIKAR